MRGAIPLQLNSRGRGRGGGGGGGEELLGSTVCSSNVKKSPLIKMFVKYFILVSRDKIISPPPPRPNHFVCSQWSSQLLNLIAATLLSNSLHMRFLKTH